MRRVTIASTLAVGAALLAAPLAAAAPSETGPVMQGECIVLMQPLHVQGIRGGPRLGLPLAPVAPVLPVGAQC